MDNILKLFVYGSLKLGECNQHVISDHVESWVDAWLKGELYLRPDKYPALFLGGDLEILGSRNYEGDLTLSQGQECSGNRIGGQLLFLRNGSELLPRLDEFEGYFPGESSEYLRVAVEVQTAQGPVSCWTYTGVAEPPKDWLSIEAWPPPGLLKEPEPYRYIR